MKRPSRAVLKHALLAGLVPALGVAASAHAQERQWESGKHLYESVCGHCHKPEVAVGPSLQGRNLPPEFLTAFVRYGVNAMPAFPASYVDDASIKELAEYLNTLPPVPPPGTEGGAQ